MTDALSSSANTTQEDISTSLRTNKNGRSQTMSTVEPKTAPPKTSTTRKIRGMRELFRACIVPYFYVLRISFSLFMNNRSPLYYL
jgi:hypothetical protein